MGFANVWPVIISDTSIHYLEVNRNILAERIQSLAARNLSCEFERNTLNWLDVFIETCKQAKP